MKPFEHILILSDLDNTFLGHASRVVPENLAAIERFKALGGKFAFATGRDPFALLRVVPDAAQIANFPCIVTNGAYVYDFATDRAFDPHPINRERLFPILKEVMPRHPEVTLRFSTMDRFLTPSITDVLRINVEQFLDVTVEIALDDIPADTLLYKTVFHSEPKYLKAFQEDITRYDLTGFAHYFSCAVLFEILDEEGTKGRRVTSLKDFDSTITHIYGVGDHENDLQLLLESDVACCPANAIDLIQSNADVHLCDSDAGAIADLISKIEHSQGGILL